MLDVLDRGALAARAHALRVLPAGGGRRVARRWIESARILPRPRAVESVPWTHLRSRSRALAKRPTAFAAVSSCARGSWSRRSSSSSRGCGSCRSARATSIRSLSENNRIRLKRVSATRGPILDRARAAAGRQPAVVRRRPGARGRARPAGGARAPQPLSPAGPGRRAPGARRRVREPPAAVRGRRAPPRRRLGHARQDRDASVRAARACRCRSARGAPIRSATIAAHLLGYVGEVNRRRAASAPRLPTWATSSGNAGAERYWEENTSAAIDGGQQVEVDAVGRKLRVLAEVDETRANILVLTIDRDLQQAAEQAMGDHDGAVVALDPTHRRRARDGEPAGLRPQRLRARHHRRRSGVLWSTDPHHPLNNKAIQGQYPPGSTFKVVIAAAALEEGVINPFTAHLLRRRLHFGNRDFRCWKKGGHGTVNLHEALVGSCDVFFYQVGQRLGVDTIAEYAHRFGLGAPTGITLDHESGGIIPLASGSGSASASRGTRARRSRSRSARATSPRRRCRWRTSSRRSPTAACVYRPHFVEAPRARPTETSIRASPKEARLGVRASTMSDLQAALRDVVNSDHGTGKKARVRWHRGRRQDRHLAGVQLGGGSQGQPRAAAARTARPRLVRRVRAGRGSGDRDRGPHRARRRQAAARSAAPRSPRQVLVTQLLLLRDSRRRPVRHDRSTGRLDCSTFDVLAALRCSLRSLAIIAVGVATSTARPYARGAYGSRAIRSSAPGVVGGVGFVGMMFALLLSTTASSSATRTWSTRRRSCCSCWCRSSAASAAAARRWIDLGSFSLQPSEMIKVALVIALARYLPPRTARRATLGAMAIVDPGHRCCAVPAALDPRAARSRHGRLSSRSSRSASCCRRPAPARRSRRSRWSRCSACRRRSLWAHLKPYQQQRCSPSSTPRSIRSAPATT